MLYKSILVVAFIPFSSHFVTHALLLMDKALGHEHLSCRNFIYTPIAVVIELCARTYEKGRGMWNSWRLGSFQIKNSCFMYNLLKGCSDFNVING